jgi:colanic acid/amylovoran biosynthesis glycosyltransferase
MRLAYLLSQYPTITHTYLLREVRALRSLGLEIHVISVRRADRPPEELSPEELIEWRQTFTVLGEGFGAVLLAHAETILHHPMGYMAGMWEAIRLSGSHLRKLISNVVYFGESVVAGHHMVKLGLRHLHSHYSSTLGMLIARTFPLTFSATIHGSAEFNDVIGFHMAEKLAAAQFVCVISSYGRSQVMKATDPECWSKIELAPLGVDCNLFFARPHRAHPEPFEIISVGSLEPAKGVPILIAAIHRLVRQGRSVRLRLVGDGSLKHQLERNIAAFGLQNHVRLEGSCSNERVKEIYKETDLFALASFSEGIPVVLMEAMAMEIPCVATWITGIPELIRHGIDGWLVPPGDEEQLADVIARLMDDAELRKRLGESARVRVQEKFELSKNVSKLADIYRRRLMRDPS